jgi:hypothetical protein
MRCNERTVEIIKQVLAKHPDLTYDGFTQGDRRKIALAERQAEIEASRQEMLTDYAVDEFHRAVRWLERQPKTKNINRRAGTSYGLKERPEAESTGYVSGGMFIAAAVACGFTVERAGDNSADAWLNIRRAWITEPS